MAKRVERRKVKKSQGKSKKEKSVVQWQILPKRKKEIRKEKGNKRERKKD